MPDTQTLARPGELVRIRGERWRIARRTCYPATTLVEADGCDGGNRGVRSRFLLPFEPVESVQASPAPRVVRPPRWRAVARRVLGDATLGWTSLRSAARARIDIIPFQLEPALSLVRGDGCRFLIADAVGLGKTVQAGLMMAELRHRQPEARAVVVCPAGLRDQWCDELRTRFDLHAAVLDAAGVARAAAALPARFNPWLAHPLVITSIDYVKRPEVIRCLETLLWDIVVFDEAHGLAGHSDRSAAASALAARARVVVMLTATPHSGDADAFNRMCAIGRLGGDDPLLLFNRARSEAGIPGSRRAVLLRVELTAAEARMHEHLDAYARRVWRHASAHGGAGARLAMSVLARRASSSAASLARSVERRLTLLADGALAARPQLELPFGVEASDDDALDSVLAAPGLGDADEERRHLVRILALARAASSAESKMDAVRRLIRRTDEPAIVFTEYRDTLEHLASALTGVTCVRLHGGLTPRERAEAVHRFTGGSARILLATDAASEGLNLHHRCRLVVNLELPWTPLRLEQRAGRVDRIGQGRRVHAVHLVAARTAEEYVLARLVSRVTTARTAIGTRVFASLPGVEDVAEAVLGGSPIADVGGPSSPEGTVSPILIRQSLEEAHRIRAARMLLRHAADQPGDARPLVTSLARRRHSHVTPGVLWVFRLLLVDEAGRGVSEDLLSLACGRGPAVRLRTPSALRAYLDLHSPGLLNIVAQARDRRLATLAQDRDQPLRTWLRRERAISASLRLAHARLSAQLVQLGLFDRRSDRVAAAQSSLLDDAMLRCEGRIAGLVAQRSVRVESSDLTLAVAFE